MNAIEIKNVSVTYPGGVRALNDVSFDIKKGEIFGLLGPNGAGKSTLINTFIGIVKPCFGSVTVLNSDPQKNLIYIKERTGFVPQELSYDGFFNVEETLKLFSAYYGKLKNPYVDELLNVLGLWEKRKENTRFLSGGMKRRLMVAKALVHNPELLVLDEPTAGVDIQLRNDLWEYIRKLNKNGATVILTTHYLNEAETMCKRVAILNEGKLLALDNVSTLKNNFTKMEKMDIYFPADVKVDLLNLEGLNYCYSKKENKIEITFPKKDYKKIFNLINSLEVNIEKIDIKNLNLEEIFVNLTNTANNSADSSLKPPFKEKFYG